MDSITEKIAKVTDLSTYTDLTPDRLKKLFEEIGGSPEKLRTILNLWFVPDFKPTFTKAQDYAFNGLQDVDTLDSPNSEQVQRPLRLIDLETGNLVDVWNTSPLDSYCMLSHRWKGDEITLAHIKRARGKQLARMTNGELVEHGSDIQLVLQQSRLDILEQETTILSLLGTDPEGRTIGDLIEMRITANDAKAQMNWARHNRDAKKSNVERCRMEKDMFDHLMARIQQDVNDNPEETTKSKSITSPVVDEAEKEYANAQEVLNASMEKENKANDSAKFLRGDRQLGDAVDEMVSRLQRWKSAIKLDRSMKEANNIFQTKLFPKQGTCYMWSDTCCIDKLNYGELSQSLSLMGDWYANADFCLVHLDTDWRAIDAVHDWKQFKKEQSEHKAGIPSFGAIEGTNPEWANRAWTLQELVMSKIAYFTNSDWKSLSRPIESLGYIYPLIPFIELYTRGDITDMCSDAFKTEETETETLRAIKNSEVIESLCDKDEVVVPVSEGEDQHVTESVKVAVRLILILRALGFVFPTDMTVETAVPEMSRSVYLAVYNLVRDDRSGTNERGKTIIRNLESYMPSTLRGESLSAEVKTQNLINFLLVCLVVVTKDPVISDRRTIANFGQVSQLESWKRGTARSGFPAERVLQLSCRRKATVPVDHVYSLMGILDVRFQTFHAEGYPKALSRLLDEVVISHNDVSVFNWAGISMGSPVRGRSMYPASHKAYGNDQDHGRRYNMMVSAEVQRKRKEVMATYQGIITMLRNAIDCIKTKGREGLPLDWVREICAFVRGSTFDSLQPELQNISKILQYIRDFCIQAIPTSTPDPAYPPAAGSRVSTEESAPSVSDVKAGTGWGFNKPSLPSMKIQSNRRTPKLPTFGVGAMNKPPFGRHHSEPVEKDVEPVSNSPTPSKPKPSAPKVPEWISLDQQVKAYLNNLSSPNQDSAKDYKLPSRIQELESDSLETEMATEDHVADTNGQVHGDDLICPNPIIINSSGIEGVFDIQRIIVTMIDRDKLLRQVAKATSSKQKISGWCTISTGFASVIVNFSCEQHILKKQLDIEQAVEDRIIKGDRAKMLHSDLEIQVAAKPREDAVLSAEESRPIAMAENVDKTMTGSSKPTEEEQTVMRIINFIQEPQLQLVAGEWVLARFSGARGAKWFLCYLELGSTHSFYGRRIPTTEIDFINSAVEPGLVNAWQTYMGRKKRKMCNILDTYIKSAASATKGQERLKKSSEIATENYAKLMDAGNQSLERVKSIGSVSTSPSMLKLPFQQSTTEESQIAEDLNSEDDEGPGKSFLDDILDQGKEAATALGEYTVLAAYEKICEMQAKHLDKHLATSVLKRTPLNLQTAVEK
ncbi:hypothetical protein ACLX1H_004877 [Fusarium chlamydosporum]